MSNAWRICRFSSINWCVPCHRLSGKILSYLFVDCDTSWSLQNFLGCCHQRSWFQMKIHRIIEHRTDDKKITDTISHRSRLIKFYIQGDMTILHALSNTLQNIQKLTMEFQACLYWIDSNMLNNIFKLQSLIMFLMFRFKNNLLCVFFYLVYICFRCLVIWCERQFYKTDRTFRWNVW